MQVWWKRILDRFGFGYSPAQRIEIPDGADIAFLGEKTGDVEYELKSKLREVFDGKRTVSRAYLAMLQYSPGAPITVALCMTFQSRHPDQATIVGAAGAFHAIFNPTQMLDIIPLSEDQERAVSRVCPPFYEAS